VTEAMATIVNFNNGIVICISSWKIIFTKTGR
jgi:hypothetical protein